MAIADAVNDVGPADGPEPHADETEPAQAPDEQPETRQAPDEQPETPHAGLELICVPLVGSRTTGKDPSSPDGPGWHRHESGRWVVGDPGSQLGFDAKPSNKVQARSDLSLDWAGHGALEYRAATIRGLAHFGDGKPRQDSCSVAFTPDRRWLVGCVADGVSSGSLSHVAADLACDMISRRITSSLGRLPDQSAPVEEWATVAAGLDWQQGVDAASEAIRDKAMDEFVKGYRNRGDAAELQRLEENGLPYSSARTLMATTAIGFVVGTEYDHEGRVPFALTVAAGDSAALILSEGRWHPITHVKNAGAEVASSEVRPLPREGAVQPLGGFLHPGQALAVITDGIGDPLGSGRGVVGEFLAEQWERPPDPIAFANDIAFYRRTFVDDRTAVLIWVRRPDRRVPS